MRRYIILDVDGVLLPHESTWLRVTVEVLCGVRVNISAGEMLDFVNTPGGGNFALAAQHVCQANALAISYDYLWKNVSSKMSTLQYPKDESTDELSNFIRQYSEECHFGIVTSREHKETEIILESLNIRRHCRVIVGRDDVLPDRSKPLPDSLYLALSLGGRKSDTSIYVGDTLDDMLAAKSAGVPSLFVMSELALPKTLDTVRQVSALSSTRNGIATVLVPIPENDLVLLV